MHIAFRLAGAALLALGAGCTTYDVHVASRALPAASHPNLTSYTLRDRSPAGAIDAAGTRAMQRELKAALSTLGYWEVPDARAAELIIDVYCGFDTPLADYQTASPNSGPAVSMYTDANDEIIIDATARRTAGKATHLTAVCRENRVPAEGHSPPIELWRVNAAVIDEFFSPEEGFAVLATAIAKQIGSTTNGIQRLQIATDDPSLARIKHSK